MSWRALLTPPLGVKNLFDTRVMVETALVRQAATEAGKDDIAELKEALERGGNSGQRALLPDQRRISRSVLPGPAKPRVARGPLGVHGLAFAAMVPDATAAGQKTNQL